MLPAVAYKTLKANRNVNILLYSSSNILRTVSNPAYPNSLRCDGKNCLEWVAAMPPSLGGAGGSCYRFSSGQTLTGVPTISLRDKE
ncbi:hypothetical protein T01_5523 [Trichinella spiralis]|uniref:Uncharacterized protein n=1 Tax=Trichinella spiralis TaxID=6334 RepID=A0A0V1BVF0_TRISP|nr:hypothetical protein T01_5523 [Trichinella spiralis]